MRGRRPDGREWSGLRIYHPPMAHDDLLNQPPEEVEMSLDVIVLACTGACHCCDCADGGRVHGCTNDEGPWLPFFLSGRSCEIDFKFLTLLLEVVEHFDLPHHGLVAMMFTICVDLSCRSTQYGFRSRK